jgi:hypothetical protein
MKTATKVKDLNGFNGTAALYKLSEPINEYEYVIVSAINDKYCIETYIFGSNENGEVLNWSELEGSTRGVHDHQIALNEAGYEVNE